MSSIIAVSINAIPPLAFFLPSFLSFDGFTAHDHNMIRSTIYILTPHKSSSPLSPLPFSPFPSPLLHTYTPNTWHFTHDATRRASIYSIYSTYQPALYRCVLVFSSAEPLTFGSAFYFIIVTVSTVGYGDISPDSAAAKLLTLLVIIIGFTVIPTQVTALVSAGMYVRV